MVALQREQVSLELLHRSTSVGDLVLLGRVHLGVPSESKAGSGDDKDIVSDRHELGDGEVYSRLLESIRLEDRVPSDQDKANEDV